MDNLASRLRGRDGEEYRKPRTSNRHAAKNFSMIPATSSVRS